MRGWTRNTARALSVSDNLVFHVVPMEYLLRILKGCPCLSIGNDINFTGIRLLSSISIHPCLAKPTTHRFVIVPGPYYYRRVNLFLFPKWSIGIYFCIKLVSNPCTELNINTAYLYSGLSLIKLKNTITYFSNWVTLSINGAYLYR